MRGAAHGQRGRDVTSSKTPPNGDRVVAAIPQHTVWPLSGSSPFAVQWRNRIDQRQGFLRVVPIRAGQTHGERHASPVANQMALAPPLRPIGGIRTSMVTTMHRADGGGANTSSPNRTRVPAGASANRCRCGGRTKCRSGTRDPKCAAVRPSADVVQWARTVRLDPTMDREAALQPYPFTRLRRRGSGFGGFVTYS
jgi:hypothetical protein